MATPVADPAAAYPKYERLTIVTAAPGVLLCALARPKKLNAFDPQMWADVREFFGAVERDSATRAVLLCGAGRAFTCGK